MKMLWVFLGGGLGSMARYAVSLFAQQLPASFPYATLISNISASLILGFFAGHLISNESTVLRLLVIVGFCGGFSTFSSFSFENFELLKSNQIFSALLNIVGNTLLCLIAIFIGFALGRNS